MQVVVIQFNVSRDGDMVCSLPSIHCFSVRLKLVSGERFGEVVSSLQIGWAPLNAEVSLIVLIPKPMPFDEEIFSSVGNAVIGSKVVCSLIILKHRGPNRRVVKRGVLDRADHLLNESLQGEESLEGVG